MSATAGFVDAGCYQRLRHTYTSHITGATASAAANVMRAVWPDAARFAWAVISFVLGALIGTWLRRMEHRNSIRSAFAAVLALEVLLLALFIAGAGYPGFAVFALVFFAAAAMGMQTVTVNRVGKLRVYTTFHTGSLSKFSESLMEHLFWVRDRTRGRFRERIAPVLRVTPRREPVQHAAISIGVWIAFAAGALAGIPAMNRWGSISLLFAMAPLAAAILVDLTRPREVGEKDPGTDME